MILQSIDECALKAIQMAGLCHLACSYTKKSCPVSKTTLSAATPIGIIAENKVKNVARIPPKMYNYPKDNVRLNKTTLYQITKSAKSTCADGKLFLRNTQEYVECS